MENDNLKIKQDTLCKDYESGDYTQILYIDPKKIRKFPKRYQEILSK